MTDEQTPAPRIERSVPGAVTGGGLDPLATEQNVDNVFLELLPAYWLAAAGQPARARGRYRGASSARRPLEKFRTSPDRSLSAVRRAHARPALFLRQHGLLRLRCRLSRSPQRNDGKDRQYIDRADAT
jgi:hypothetical protein